MIPREANFSTKQEIDAQTSKADASSSSTTTAWSKSKDPRIVRVSRAFGGKDRHSKVCTVRGLRDRRVRLSVPTAIQLYDLQDRLGLSQPSKVVDWLLNAAKNEIDELPPLQIPQGQSLQSFFSSHHGFIASDSDKQLGQKINWADPMVGGKSKDVSGETSYIRDGTWDTQGGYNNFLSRQNPSSHSSLMNSTTLPYNSFARWDPPNLTLSHPPQSLIGSSSAQVYNPPNFSLVQIPSGSSHQVLVYQPGMSAHPYFPSQPSPMDTEFNPK